MSSTDEKTHGETVDSSVAEKTAKVEVKEEPEDRIEAAVDLPAASTSANDESQGKTCLPAASADKEEDTTADSKVRHALHTYS